MEQQKKNVDKFIEKIDRQLEASDILYRNIRTDESIMKKLNELKSSKDTNVDWEKVEAKAKAMNQKECAICIDSLSSHHKQKYILSCGHVYHKHCLDSFERFDLAGTNKCPMCRAMYSKKLIENQL